MGAAAAALAVICGTPALAQAPEGDHYLQSLPLNDPGEPLDRRNTLTDQRDTTNFTVQTDLFNPDRDGRPGSGGPPEPTTCGGANFGKTAWYDFYPDVPGLVVIQTSGYDSVIAVMQYDRNTGAPILASGICSNQRSSSIERGEFPVRKGGFYTIQVGAVNDVAGNLTFEFDFHADVDRDGVLDGRDECRTLPGSREDGCPPRLNADSLIRALPTATGVRVLSLAVRAPRRSRVAVSCTRRACPSEVRRARSTVRLRRIRGRNLPAGSKLVIRVTRRRAIGTYIAYRIQAGNFKKIERCLNPGSRTPRKRCG